MLGSLNSERLYLRDIELGDASWFLRDIELIVQATGKRVVDSPGECSGAIGQGRSPQAARGVRVTDSRLLAPIARCQNLQRGVPT